MAMLSNVKDVFLNLWDKVVEFVKDFSFVEFWNSLSAGARSTVIICVVIGIFAIVAGMSFRKADPLSKKQPRMLFLIHWFVDKVDGFVQERMGPKFRYLTPYFMFVFLYLPASFMLGLLGMEAPASAWVSNLCLAVGTWIFIHITAIKSRKWRYYQRYFSVDNTNAFNVALNCVFTPINVATVVVPIVSLSFRLFGNALAGTIIMTLIYAATASLSNIFVGFGTVGLSILLGSIIVLMLLRQLIKNKKIKLGALSIAMIVVFAITVLYSAFDLKFNFVGVFVAPLLHLYFDLFGTYIQTLVFTFLSSSFITDEVVE